MGRVCVGPGLSRATFCPSGETHTSFCPGIHVSGMFVSIVTIFCPGGAGIWLGAAALPYTCGERRMPCHTRSLRGGKIADVKLKPAEVSLASRAVHVYRTTSIHGVEAPGQNSDTYTALGWSSHDGPRTMGTSGGRMGRRGAAYPRGRTRTGHTPRTYS